MIKTKPSTFEQEMMSALLDIGKGTSLDVNRDYQELFSICGKNWFNIPVYYRSLMIVAHKKVNGEDVNFECDLKDLNAVATYIHRYSDSKKIKQLFSFVEDD